MAMKRRGGTKSKTIERMLNVFQSTFSASEMKQCLEFALAKLRRICKHWLMLTIQTVMSVGYTVLLLSAKTKQENQRNEASRLSENVLKRAQRYLT